MGSQIRYLKKYFEAGTAEGDNTFLKDVFVTPKEYAEFISVPTSGPRILLGNKGSGKSAALRYFKLELENLEMPVILLRPKEIDLRKTEDSALGALTRASESAILSAIARKLGTGIKGLVTSPEDQTLLKVAQQSGEVEKDFIERALSILNPIGKKLTDINFDELIKKDEPSQIQIRKAIEESLNKSQQAFYVLIDDTDQVAHPGEPDHLNRIWAFLLAARSINESCGNIKFIITMRDEVWRRLNRDTAGQRDQVDHFRNLAKRISFSEETLKEIIKKRLNTALEEFEPSSTIEPYSCFFETKHVQIPTADKQYRYWDDFLVGRSRQRPRDSIQLIYKLCEQAIKKSSEKISSGEVALVMPIYSEERVDDLKRECEEECPQIKEVIRAFHDASFDGGSFTLSPQIAANFISELPSRFSISLFSRTLSAGNSDDTFKLWRYLHEVGFLNARVSDIRESKGYRHVSPHEDPDLVSQARWNEMQSILWEINPAYRDYLINVQKEKSFSFGQPKKNAAPRRKRSR